MIRSVSTASSQGKEAASRRRRLLAVREAQVALVLAPPFEILVGDVELARVRVDPLDNDPRHLEAAFVDMRVSLPLRLVLTIFLRSSSSDGRVAPLELRVTIRRDYPKWLPIKDVVDLASGATTLPQGLSAPAKDPVGRQGAVPTRSRDTTTTGTAGSRAWWHADTGSHLCTVRILRTGLCRTGTGSSASEDPRGRFDDGSPCTGEGSRNTLYQQRGRSWSLLIIRIQRSLATRRGGEVIRGRAR